MDIHVRLVSVSLCCCKEPRHLQFVAEFCDSDVYTLLSARKTHGAPTDYAFCVKVCVPARFQHTLLNPQTLKDYIFTYEISDYITYASCAELAL